MPVLTFFEVTTTTTFFPAASLICFKVAAETLNLALLFALHTRVAFVVAFPAEFLLIVIVAVAFFVTLITVFSVIPVTFPAASLLVTTVETVSLPYLFFPVVFTVSLTVPSVFVSTTVLFSKPSAVCSTFVSTFVPSSFTSVLVSSGVFVVSSEGLVGVEIEELLPGFSLGWLG